MRSRFNEDLLLWAIGTLQPASIGDALALIREVFPDVPTLPWVRELESVVCRWVDDGYLMRVHGKSRLYSVTSYGNQKLPVPVRRHRDKARLFLLASVRDARFQASGEAQQRLAGASPAEGDSGDIQEGSRPISLDAVPRGPRHSLQTYWPRVVKQLDFEVGSEPRSPDIFLDYYSFPDAQSLHRAAKSRVPREDLSITELALAIGVSPRLLTSFIHDPARHYRQFEIGKRGGGTRQISAPKVFLKTVQHWILDYILWSLPVHSGAHAYRKDRSILTNAATHLRSSYVANIDIKDFFGSVTKAMLERLLQRQGFGPRLANAVARLTTFDGVLPQGAPTSPLLSNAYMFEFDLAMTAYAEAQRLSYSRYADDITLSGEDRDKVVRAIRCAASLLRRRGLQLNDKKTRIASRGGQQKVTGVVVNEKLQPPRRLRRKVRAMFHQAEMNPKAFRDRLPELRGFLSYLRSFPYLTDSEELIRYGQVLAKLRERKR